MNRFTYVGAMKPSIPSNNFGTSLFQDEKGDYYIQQDEDDIIQSFHPIEINRVEDIIRPEDPVSVQEGDAFIYSYLNYTGGEEDEEVEEGKTRLIYGIRAEIEYLLLPLMNEDNINVHARLLISSFLKLFQSTLDLVDASNKDLEEKGIQNRIKRNILFEHTSEEASQSPDIISSIWHRYNQFRLINVKIRICDIVFLQSQQAYFTRFQLKLEMVVNKRSLETEERRRAISELVHFCTRENKPLLDEMLNAETECYDFMIQSEFLFFNQQEIESTASEIIENGKGIRDDTSYLAIGMKIDKQIHPENNDQPSLDIGNISIDDPELQKSVLSIIKKL